MTRAEERALEAYPLPDLPEVLRKRIITSGTRKVYQEGYEQCEKDIMEKAEKWIKANCDAVCNADAVFADFKKAMKKEEQK